MLYHGCTPGNVSLLLRNEILSGKLLTHLFLIHAVFKHDIYLAHRTNAGEQSPLRLRVIESAQ